MEPLVGASKSTPRTLLSHDRPCVGDYAGNPWSGPPYRVHWKIQKRRPLQGGEKVASNFPSLCLTMTKMRSVSPFRQKVYPPHRESSRRTRGVAQALQLKRLLSSLCWVLYMMLRRNLSARNRARSRCIGGKYSTLQYLLFHH